MPNQILRHHLHPLGYTTVTPGYILSPCKHQIIQFDIDIEINPADVFDTFTLVDEHSLKEIVWSLKNKSSPDDLSIEFIKTYWEQLKTKLVHIINCSLENGTVPEKFKLATIIPIRKVQSTIKSEEFRPINILPALSKILEKVVYLQIINFVEKNKILSNYLSGFRRNFNCETAF